MRGFMTPYRCDRAADGSYEVRWLVRPCGALACVAGHPEAIIAFDGRDRWAPMARGPADFDDEAEVIDQLDELEDALRLVVAAFGLPWDVLLVNGSAPLCMQEVQVFDGVGPMVRELAHHDVDELLGMRRMVGRDVSAMGELLAMLGRYREDIGGAASRVC
jgi:hypothetical protein